MPGRDSYEKDKIARLAGGDMTTGFPPVAIAMALKLTSAKRAMGQA
jgi:hypothetical protein